MKSFFKKIVVGILSWEAHAVIRKNKPAIIAITGSVGKTSTKDVAYHILASSGVFVRKSEKSFNSEIGVPLTILGLQNAWSNPVGWMYNIFHGLTLVFPILGNGSRAPYPKCLVLEVGADHPGDIVSLTKWLKPDIATITAVSKIPVHVEFFSSPAAVLQEKLALVRGINFGGKLVLPSNDESILAVRKEAPQNSKVDLSKAPCLTFGVEFPADITAGTPQIIYENDQRIEGSQKPVGMSFILKYREKQAVVSILGIIGTQHIYSVTAATAIALSYGIDFNLAVASLSEYKPPRGRMNLLEGIIGSVLIDDTYNASPDALKEALKILGSIKTDRKIAVLGDMMELGKFSSQEHRKAGELVAEAFALGSRNVRNDSDFSTNSDMKIVHDILITVGIRARDIALGAIAAGLSESSVHSFDTSVEAGEWLRNLLHKESLLQGNSSNVILIKGSQSSRMERVTYALLNDQSRAKDLLVRQDAEWLAKK